MRLVGPPTVGDEAQDLRRIQHGGVGRCEVERDKHGRIGEDGYAGHRHTREQGDRAMPDVLRDPPRTRSPR